MKTGTPPRLDGRTIDWASLEAQPGDDPPEPLSFMTERIANRQVACAITATTPATHAIIRENLHRSAAYGGGIAGRGPRYCPSVEDKVVRFAERERHQVFLEPEGLDDPTVYPNGISTSLPEEVQAAPGRLHPWAGTGAHPPAGLRHRVRPRGPALPRPEPRGSRRAGAVPGGPDQRHHRLRGSGRAGDHGRAERRAPRGRRAARPGARPGGSLYWRPGGRPGAAGRDRALPHADGALRIPAYAPGRQCRVPARRARPRLGLRRRGRAAAQCAYLDELQALARSRRGRRAPRPRSTPRTACRSIRTDDGAASSRCLACFRTRRRRQGDVPVAARRRGRGCWTNSSPKPCTPRISRGRRRAFACCRPRNGSPCQPGSTSHAFPDLSLEMRQRLEAAKPSSLGAASRVPGLTPAALAALAVHLRVSPAAVFHVKRGQ